MFSTFGDVGAMPSQHLNGYSISLSGVYTACCATCYGVKVERLHVLCFFSIFFIFFRPTSLVLLLHQHEKRKKNAQPSLIHLCMFSHPSFLVLFFSSLCSLVYFPYLLLQCTLGVYYSQKCSASKRTLHQS